MAFQISDNSTVCPTAYHSNENFKASHQHKGIVMNQTFPYHVHDFMVFLKFQPESFTRNIQYIARFQ